MRKAFIKTLTELSKKNDNIYLLTGDTGFTVLDEYQKLFPSRYLNIGLSEANMIGVSAGLALNKKIVFVYGIVPFVTMRCFEQVRIDLCYQKLPVKIIGVGGGLTYGSAGATHHSIEDIAIMSCLPNMTVICPGDPVETSYAVEASMNLDCPAYIRLGKSGEPILHNNLKSFTIGQGIVMKKGDDVGIISTGNMLETALSVSNKLTKNKIESRVISMHTVKPIDRKLIIQTASKCNTIVTIEEHNVISGLGSMVANVIVEESLSTKLIKFGIPDKYVDIVGEQPYLRNYFGLGEEQITNRILSYVRARGNPK